MPKEKRSSDPESGAPKISEDRGKCLMCLRVNSTLMCIIIQCNYKWIKKNLNAQWFTDRCLIECILFWTKKKLLSFSLFFNACKKTTSKIQFVINKDWLNSFMIDFIQCSALLQVKIVLLSWFAMLCKFTKCKLLLIDRNGLGKRKIYIGEFFNRFRKSIDGADAYQFHVSPYSMNKKQRCKIYKRVCN